MKLEDPTSACNSCCYAAAPRKEIPSQVPSAEGVHLAAEFLSRHFRTTLLNGAQMNTTRHISTLPEPLAQ